MTAKVNLLPETSRASARQATARLIAGTLVLVVLLGLGGVWFWLNAQLSSAEEQLADERAIVAGLEADVDALAEFAELERLQVRADERISLALSREVSFAGFLQDVALVVPNDAQLDSMSLSLEADAEEAGIIVGGFQLSGKSLESHAPGVERLLLQFEKVGTISEPFVNSSTLDEPDDPDDRVTTFSLDGRINATALTRRYEYGLPEVLR